MIFLFPTIFIYMKMMIGFSVQLFASSFECNAWLIKCSSSFGNKWNLVFALLPCVFYNILNYLTLRSCLFYTLPQSLYVFEISVGLSTTHTQGYKANCQSLIQRLCKINFFSHIRYTPQYFMQLIFFLIYDFSTSKFEFDYLGKF